uniref:Uncharacterized protein n=1 Tax=Anguilla anguilla TaxID=7936 RepID=A0A0E9SYV4_ANGAN
MPGSLPVCTLPGNLMVLSPSGLHTGSHQGLYHKASQSRSADLESALPFSS